MSKQEIPVVVCTAQRGVFFGYTSDPQADVVVLARARQAFFWQCTAGILELGESGPKAGSKVGARAPELHLRNITAVFTCTEAAVRAWESAEWSR